MLKGPLARATLRTSVVLGLRFVVLGLTLWLVARLLGPDSFALFASVASLAVLLGAVSTFGMHLVLLAEVSREGDRLPDVMATALPVTLLSGSLFLLAYLLLAAWLFQHPGFSWSLVVLLGVAELLLQPVVLLAAMSHQAAGRVARSQLLLLFPLALRLVSVGAIVLLQPADPLQAYAVGCLGASVIALVLAMATYQGRWPRPSAWRFPGRRDWREASGYAALNVAMLGPSEVDKVLMPRVLSLEAAGIYAAGARVVGVLTLPVVAMMLSALPRLFRASGEAGGNTDRLLRATLLAALVYGLAMALVLSAVAPLLERLFGQQYRGMALVVAALVPAVPGMALRVVAGTSLMALGRPWMRVCFELAGVCVLVLAALALAPGRGATGMATAVVVSEWVMAVLGLALVLRVRADAPPSMAP